MLRQAGTNMELKEKILEATIKAFNQKGLKFTMDDIATELSMSKKTLYIVFADKESLLYEMVDYCFDNIKECENRIMNDTRLNTVEKIRAILGVLPDGYRDIDFRQLYQLRDKYPGIYRRMEERLENGWEDTIDLINLGMKEGVIRPVNIYVLKTMLEAAIEQFFRRDVLLTNKIPYSRALQEVVDILVDGITVKEKEREEKNEPDLSE